uniref:Putative LOV domain-containing protein n=1 Tax=Eremosphaera viridis TaxID=163307 RepID=A0A126WZT1_9CHLO|nr:putative LOV domain-containing protein [Eremosphaera viridis]
MEFNFAGVIPDKLPPGIAERFNVAETDENSLRMLSNLLYGSPCAVAITDACAEDNPIVYVNRTFELQTGYTSAEVVGRNCRFLQAPLGRERTPCFASMALRKAIEAGSKRTLRLLNYRKDGTPMWNQLSIVPLHNSKKIVTHFIGMQTFRVADELLPSTAASSSSAHVGTAAGSLPKSSLMIKSKSCTCLSMESLECGAAMAAAY